MNGLRMKGMVSGDRHYSSSGKWSGRYAWHFAFLSVLVASVSHVISFDHQAWIPTWLMDFLCEINASVLADHGLLRSYLFFAIHYMFILPVYFLIFSVLTAKAPIRFFGFSQRITDRVFYGSFGILFCLVLTFSPLYVISVGESPKTYAGMVRDALIHSYAGLIVFGGIAMLATSCCFTAALVIFPRIIFNRYVR